MLEFIQNRLYNIVEDFIKLIVLIIVFFEDIRYLLTGVIILIITDQVTGVWRACKKNKFSWVIFNKFYTKLILYLLAIISTFFYSEYLIESNQHYITKGLGAIIGFQELSSTYLNISVITGKDIFNKYLSKLPSNKI